MTDSINQYLNKMKRFKLYLIGCLAFVLLSATTCGPNYEFVRFENYSDDSIVIFDDNWTFDHFDYEYIESLTKTIPSGGFCDRVIVYDSHGEEGYTDDLYIGVVKCSRLKEIPYDSIIKHNLWDKFYHYKFHELEDMEFRIVYTGR